MIKLIFSLILAGVLPGLCYGDTNLGSSTQAPDVAAMQPENDLMSVEEYLQIQCLHGKCHAKDSSRFKDKWKVLEPLENANTIMSYLVGFNTFRIFNQSTYFGDEIVGLALHTYPTGFMKSLVAKYFKEKESYFGERYKRGEYRVFNLPDIIPHCTKEYPKPVKTCITALNVVYKRCTSAITVPEIEYSGMCKVRQIMMACNQSIFDQIVMDCPAKALEVWKGLGEDFCLDRQGRHSYWSCYEDINFPIKSDTCWPIGLLYDIRKVTIPHQIADHHTNGTDKGPSLCDITASLINGTLINDYCGDIGNVTNCITEHHASNPQCSAPISKLRMEVGKVCPGTVLGTLSEPQPPNSNVICQTPSWVLLATLIVLIMRIV